MLSVKVYSFGLGDFVEVTAATVVGLGAAFNHFSAMVK